jgi:cell fate (sporulation/competence/biofilm development) regulator YlbF (YheA/YmcA/DUF963 family)
MLIYDQIHRLAREITETEEYQKLILAQEKLCQSEANWTMLEDFQKKQNELNKLHMAGETLSKEKVEQMEQLMEVMMMNPIIRDYRIAEMILIRLMGEVEKILWDAVKPALVFKENVE